MKKPVITGPSDFIIFAVLIITAALFNFLTVPRAGASDGKGTEEGEGETLRVVCTLFPQYDFARQVAGDRAEVSLLLPPGTEAHSFEPRPLDIKKLNESDLFIFTGRYMEPWAERVARSLEADGPLVLDASKGIELIQDGHHDHDTEHGEHGHAHGFDPHVWLDLSLAQRMVWNITEGLCERDPGHSDFYKKNAAALCGELDELDREIRSAVMKAGRRTLVFGGRFACRYFLRHYGLDCVTAYSGESEPDIRSVTETIRYVKDNGVRYVLYDESGVSQAARLISEQTGAGLLLFHTAHNVTRSELDSGVSFQDIMRANCDAAALALNY